MADIEERLLPKDGLNNYNIVLARMDLPTHGGAQFTFAVTDSMLPAGEFVVSVPNAGQSLDRMTVEAHDQMLDILRQLTFRAERARVNHDRNARAALSLGTRVEEGLLMERSGRQERRAEQFADAGLE